MLIHFWHRLLGWLDRKNLWSTPYRAEHVADLPDRPRRDVVYIVGEDGYDWTAAMLCPGGCGKVLEMNLLPDAHPVWKVSERPDRIISLHPSVWLKTGCACHFVLAEGRVKWV
jgi:hypothetical protein